jgi:hypothetical protein
MISVRQEHIFRVFSQPPAVSVRTSSVFRHHPTAEAVSRRAFQGQNPLPAGYLTLASPYSCPAHRLLHRHIPAFQPQPNAIGCPRPLTLLPLHTD